MSFKIPSSKETTASAAPTRRPRTPFNDIKRPSLFTSAHTRPKTSSRRTNASTWGEASPLVT